MRRELLEGPIALTLLRKTLPVIGGMIAWWQIRRVLAQTASTTKG